MIRLKDFVLTRVVDFLQDNLLIIIVVTSLLIVMVFIICCASAMSHKRKRRPTNPLRSNPRSTWLINKVDARSSSEFRRDRTLVDHVKRVQNQSMASPKHLRQPSKALVGEKGRDVRSSPRQESSERSGMGRGGGEEERRMPKHKEQPKVTGEEVQQKLQFQSIQCAPAAT
ncbi:transmembrane protein 119 [Notolabrus celidotus]|uniref:transmembrane protein 119 n=1 Tax=Notolabrus celidotus TaxID=1203425 RepID=UPI00149029E6|nr:transmembrane protein 119 [Notolabrus celidotus]